MEATQPSGDDVMWNEQTMDNNFMIIWKETGKCTFLSIVSRGGLVGHAGRHCPKYVSDQRSINFYVTFLSTMLCYFNSHRKEITSIMLAEQTEPFWNPPWNQCKTWKVIGQTSLSVFGLTDQSDLFLFPESSGHDSPKAFCWHKGELELLLLVGTTVDQKRPSLFFY